MTVFKEYPVTQSLNYMRVHAEELNCKLCFDGVTEEILKMNEKGKDGKLACLCKIGVSCPCDEVEKELEANGVCYCGIFRKA